jgi:serine/alanine adding enzyme
MSTSLSASVNASAPPTPAAAALRVSPTRDERGWENFLRDARGSTHCHRYGWRRVMERVFGHECIYLVAKDDEGVVRGLLPLVRVKSVLFGHYLVSMPFLNYGGPLGDATAVRALTAAAAGIAERDRVRLLELRSGHELPIDLPVSHRKITVVLDLEPGDPEVLWKRLDAKVRSQVRRPQKTGVTVRFGADQIAPFFEVFSRHMRDLGTPTLAHRFFDAVGEEFPQDVWFGCAYLHGRPIACGAALRFGGELEMTWASALVEFKKESPNMLLYWAFMERACNEGLQLFNFGRCTPDGGTHRFKKQWGSRDLPLWWYDLSREAGTTTPSPHDESYAWGPRLWKRLPVPVATFLGPRIVRCIP